MYKNQFPKGGNGPRQFIPTARSFCFAIIKVSPVQTGNKLRFEKDTKLPLIYLSKVVSLISINHLQSPVGANHRMKMDNYLSKV
ncbi:MAG: hypothetical protein ACKO90_10145, partial [Microcystis panniformis]